MKGVDEDIRLQNMLFFAYHFPNYCQYLEDNCPYKQDCVFIEKCPYPKAKIKYWLEQEEHKEAK